MELAKINTISVEAEDLLGKYLARDVVDPETGEVVAECNDEVTEKFLEEIKREKDRNLRDPLHRQYQRQLLAARYPGDGPDRIDPGGKGKIASAEPGKSVREKESERALIDIYKRLRPGDPPTIETAISLFYNLFFNPERYDLSKVGRMKLNHKIGLKGNPPRILVFTEKCKKEALEAGATFVGGKELVDRILEGWLDFDEAIATPEMTDEIQRVSKILHPIGLDALHERRDDHGRCPGKDPEDSWRMRRPP